MFVLTFMNATKMSNSVPGTVKEIQALFEKRCTG